MSGRHEHEMKTERMIENKLQREPSILKEFYYSLIGSGKTYETAYRYINYVSSFIDFTFGDNWDEQFYTNIKSLHVNKYIASLRTKNVNGKVERTSDSIRSVQWSALNTFFQFLVPNYISSNPVANTQRPKNKDNPQVTYLTPEEITSVLSNVEAIADKKIKNRDLCLLKLGFTTGLRISAILGIDVDDIDLKHNRIRITEKGDRDGYVLIGEKMKSQIEAWLKDREKYLDIRDCNSNALFISDRRLRITVPTASRMLEKYSKDITDKHVTPHVMRHSCATNLYEATGDIYLCAKQLNHKQVSTTQRYAELSKEKQKQAANILDEMI